jgi:hypothetical protein
MINPYYIVITNEEEGPEGVTLIGPFKSQDEAIQALRSEFETADPESFEIQEDFLDESVPWIRIEQFGTVLEFVVVGPHRKLSDVLSLDEG